jgi:ceramide glucosyltransferase
VIDLLDLLLWLCLLPTIGGTVYTVLVAAVVVRYMRRGRRHPPADSGFLPPVTILKPICGLEKDLKTRIRTACRQRYPAYQVVLPVQNADDPAIPLLREIEAEFGSERASVVVHDVSVGPNGKVNNLLGGLAAARHDIIVISDSDVELRPDYLASIVAPLADPRVGLVNTLFATRGAGRWYEKMELLSLNADFIPSVVFAEVTGAAGFCLGPSVAVRRSTLDAIGGFEALSQYLAEDYELGRRIWTRGLKVALVPYVVDVVLDLPDWRTWWRHQVYWDQNTRVANPLGYLATILTRSVPFALLYALLRLADPVGLAVLGAAVAARILGVAAMMHFGFRDREAIRSLPLLPLRDIAGLIVWALAFGQRTVVWRGVTFELRSDGRMMAIGPGG